MCGISRKMTFSVCWIINTAFLLEELKDDAALLKSKYEKMGYKITIIAFDEKNKIVWAIKKRPIARVSDLSYENITHISAAKLIVELGLKNYRVDPSQGTHFFQNLTSFGVGYFTINPYNNDGIFRQDILDTMPAVEETKYVRHVRFDHSIKIMMDGKKQEGVALLNED